MSVICPTITTDDPHVYRTQMELIASYSDGVHLDFADGVFAPSTLLPIDKAWRSDDLITHAHIMYQNPMEVVDDIISLEADLVILHAEAHDLKECLQTLREAGVRTGIALLPETSRADLQDLEIDGLFDHVLVFGGHLGSQGGKADLDLLDKVKRLRATYDDIEIAWDGGVTLENAAEIAKAGVDILNVGGTLKNAKDPESTFNALQEIV